MMQIDTGFDYHVDLPVAAEGVMPNKETLEVMRTNLDGTVVRDGVSLSRYERKWFKCDSGWIFVLGARKLSEGRHDG